MGQERVWNDAARDELRDRLRTVILGECRLARRRHEEIVQTCFETHIELDCPESERDSFRHFATDELNRAIAQLESEKLEWPPETDCDRLDRVEIALRQRGIVLWQASPCCDTCTLGELPDHVDAIDDRSPGFGGKLRGYAFFIDQNLPDMLAESTEIEVFFSYGWISPDGHNVARDLYNEHALAIGREVCHCLRDEGFEVSWNGQLSQKFSIVMNWQRRTMLE